MFDERIESNIWYFHGNTEEAREEERARDMEEEERAQADMMFGLEEGGNISVGDPDRPPRALEWRELRQIRYEARMFVMREMKGELGRFRTMAQVMANKTTVYVNKIKIWAKRNSRKYQYCERNNTARNVKNFNTNKNQNNKPG